MTREKSDDKDEREKKETKPTSSHKEEAKGGGVKVETTTVTKAKVDEDEGDDDSSSSKRGPGRPPAHGAATEHKMHGGGPPSHTEKQGQDRFTFVLKRQGDRAQKHDKWVSDLTTKKPNERNYATPDDFANQLGFHHSDYQPIVQYAKKHNLDLDGKRSNDVAGVFVFTADKADFEKAFPAKGKEYTIPDELKSIVKSIHGPANTLRLKHHRQKTANGLNIHDKPDVATVYANSIASYYNIPQPPAATGKGQVIGLLEFGGGFSQTDITNYFKAANISPAPSVVAVSVDGTQNTPGRDTDSDGEVNLDIDVAGAIAPGSKIVVYFADNSEQGFVEAFNYAITDKTNAPDILSISWGGPENSWSTQGLQSINQAAQSASTLGISIFAASGDDGSSDGERGENADFPGSSPYICDCGGTSLATPNTETAWTPYSGGGVSSVFPKPSWQNVTGATPTTPSGGRECPDVAFNADPNSGYTIVADGQSIVGVGGTSAAAPGWAGLTAIANSLNGKNVGFLTPLLYANPTAFKDITVGSNGAYKSGAGYDNVTGLGSPTAAVIQVLAGTFTPPPISVSAVSARTSQGTPVNLVLSAIITKTGASVSRFNIVTQPTSGSIAVGTTVTTANTISVTYTPSTGFVGTDSFTYNAVDSAGDTSNTATVSIAVTKTASGPNVRVRVQETSDLTSQQPTEWNTVYTQPPVMVGNTPPVAADNTQVSKSRIHGPEKRTVPKQEVQQKNVIK